MKYDFTFSGSGIPGKWISSDKIDSLIARQIKRQECNDNYVQVNFRFRKGSDSLTQLDYVRGDVSRSAYVKQLVEDHLTKITNLLEK
jgi:hypothetical protein